MGHKPICLPFASEAQYRVCRRPGPVSAVSERDAEPVSGTVSSRYGPGFTFHDAYASVKQDLLMRRITLLPTGAVFTLRPSFVMPSMIARTDAVEKALSAPVGPF